MHAVGPQIKEQLEAAKDPEIGEVVSAQLSSVCRVKDESFSNFFLPLSFIHHLECRSLVAQCFIAKLGIQLPWYMYFYKTLKGAVVKLTILTQTLV